MNQLDNMTPAEVDMLYLKGMLVERHPQEAQEPKCEHDWVVTGYAWPVGGRALPDDPPEYVRMQCSKCHEDTEERWT